MQPSARLRRLPVNIMPPMRSSKDKDGGLSGQQSVMARFQLEENEALVVRARASDAVYQAIQLGNYWFATPNPTMHQSSLNLSQAKVDEDGYVRYVISLKDPGVANWLDPDGSQEGYIFMRWQGISTPLTASDQPVARKILFENLADHLPEGSFAFSHSQRSAQLKDRASLPALKR